MPTWGDILTELRATTAAGGAPDFDGVRRKYLAALHDYTGRNVIVYYTDWLRGAGPQSSINLGDMQGMMEALRGLQGPSLDVILHSPGGSAEATASIVRYLRSKFADIRIFVPLAAMSAATMWALSGNVIVMGKHSQLGPIDPQVPTAGGLVAARAIVDQFERAKREIADSPGALGAWAPIIQQYGPGLLELCEKADELSRRLVAEWLEAYMFNGQDGADERAAQVSKFFGDYEQHQSHSLGIDRDQAKAQQLTILDLEQDQELQDRVLSVHHATLLTFQGPAVKLIENHLGRTFVITQGKATVTVPPNVVLPGGLLPAQPLGIPPFTT